MGAAEGTAYAAGFLAGDLSGGGRLCAGRAVGRHIVEFEQGGTARVAYGKSVLAQVSTQLSAEFGKGFDASNLYKVSQFYRAFPNLDALRLNLSWTH